MANNSEKEDIRLEILGPIPYANSMESIVANARSKINRIENGEEIAPRMWILLEHMAKRIDGNTEDITTPFDRTGV